MSTRGAAVVFAGLFAVALSGASSASAQSMNETPEQNVKASRQYQALTCTNQAFRQHRIEKECGPLQGSQFYDSCVAPFDCGKQPSAADWRKAPPSQTTR